MARIAGINIPLNKRVEIGLTYIYGIGRPTSNKLLSADRDQRPTRYVRDLTERRGHASCATSIDNAHRRG